MADVLEHAEREIEMDQVKLNVRDEVGDESDAEEVETLNEATSLPALNNADVNRNHLREIFEETQCPLVPSKYGKDGEVTGAYYFNKMMWREIGKDSCEIIECKSDDVYKQAKEDAELMMAVDKYISAVHINNSSQIHEKLMTAYEEKIDGVDDGDDSNDAYQKLIPTPVARIMFAVTCFTSALNGYFVISGCVTSAAGGYDTALMNNTALVMGICEVILYGNIFLSNIFVNFCFLLYELVTGDTVFLEAKLIAVEIRSLSTLSILRYMPSVEIVTSYLVHWKETVAKIFATIFLLCKTNTTGFSVRTNWFARIFAIPVYLVETFAPFLALFAILVKIKQLEFAISGDPFVDWEYTEYLTFFAFLNQVAGLRVLRKVETASIQHFVFSGADATLDTEELLLLENWWNVTLLSAVSNLKLNWYDNMVFWNALDPQKIQLLLKNHEKTDDGEDVLKKARESDDILDKYDQKVIRMLAQKGESKKEQ